MNDKEETVQYSIKKRTIKAVIIVYILYFQVTKRKREYSQLVMIYEEDAPFPPPSSDDETSPTP